MTPTETTKTRIAILGGGIAALTAAFELTEQDRDGSLYDISVYTLGWRLGGKAAVGRDPSRYCGGYEHGLHIWAGFYDNAFDVVKRLYARLAKDPDLWKSCFGPVRNDPEIWKSCFEPLNHFTAMENVEGTWKPWLISFPPNDLEPGLAAAPSLTPLQLLVQLLATLESAYIKSDLARCLGLDSRKAAWAEAATIAAGRPPKDDETVLTLAREAAEQLSADPSRVTDERRQALRDSLRITHQFASAIEPAGEPDELRRLRIFYDLAFGLANGLLSDDVFFKGFEAIDDIEWSEWMGRNGCRPESLESAIVRGCYDYGFIGGASKKPGIGAGTGTLLMLRFILTYKGSVLHALTEPMGESIVAPLFQYLRKWGVNFEFFCRVKKLELSETEPAVERVILAQQVRLIEGLSSYDPLVPRADGRPSWPIHPDPCQIVGGDCLNKYDLESAWTDWHDAIPERILRRRSAEGSADGAKDVFDVVVLATGFKGLKYSCQDLVARFPDTWGKFLETTLSTQTVALQLWLEPQVDELGWPDPQTALTAFELQGDSWCDALLPSWEDNTRLLRLESQRPGSQPRSLAYLVGTFPDADDIPDPGPNPAFPIEEHKRAGVAIVSWMNQRLSLLWPKAASPSGGFRWDLLEAPPATTGPDRLNFQYWKVNIDPSERYVLSAPGTVKHRLRPDDSGIDNLFLAGDWVRSGVNGGCIEAAVIAGRMAARAITESDMYISGDESSNIFSLPVGALPLINAADKLKSAAAGGVGTMEAYCATISVSVDYAKSKLPAGLDLVTPRDWPDGHPIILVFTRQRHVRPGFAPFGGLNYNEFMEVIPCVKRCDTDAPKGGPFSYMPYLLLDQPLAVLVGTNLYGFNKRLARISSRDGAFVIRSDLGEIRASFEELDLPGTFNDGDFQTIDSNRKLLELPLISQMPTGEWIYSYLDYRLDSATCQLIAGQIKIGDPFAPPNVYVPEKIDWFQFSTTWRLSIPLTSGQVSDSSAPTQLRNAATQWSRFRQLFR
jgi:uncharacterized protein with NAD-binding domain and iron-sulfur cluster